MQTLVDASGLPFATMFMDKCVLDETHPNYIGMYHGKLMNEQVRTFVEGCDCVLGIGAMLTDLNSGAFTAQIDRSKSINIMHNSVRVGSAVYNNVKMKDVLVALAKKLEQALKCFSARNRFGLFGLALALNLCVELASHRVPPVCPFADHCRQRPSTSS